MPAWLCFLPGSSVKFLIPQLETPWQSAEELGWKDRIAAKVDARDAYKFAPNGLKIVQVNIKNEGTFSLKKVSKIIAQNFQC